MKNDLADKLLDLKLTFSEFQVKWRFIEKYYIKAEKVSSLFRDPDATFRSIEKNIDAAIEASKQCSL